MTTATIPLSALPRPSRRWWPVFRRNLLVWRKLAIPEPRRQHRRAADLLVAFGYGMGALVGQVEGGRTVPYILLLAAARSA